MWILSSKQGMAAASPCHSDWPCSPGQDPFKSTLTTFPLGEVEKWLRRPLLSTLIYKWLVITGVYGGGGGVSSHLLTACILPILL